MAKNYRSEAVTNQYIVMWNGDEEMKSFTGVDADKQALAFADDMAEKNTGNKPSAWPTIVKVVREYGRKREA